MIKIGVIGMNEGNAHPISWSAIINGYFNKVEISKLGYPIINTYLQENRDTLGIKNAVVSHIWTQDRSTSRSIAKATGIEHIVSNLNEMKKKVDGVLLLRDDAENHVLMAKPFIDADIPIFIDKPLAISSKEMSYFSNEASKGKFIMSCSSMRFSDECLKAKSELRTLGNLQLVTAVGKKDWLKYGVHLLEGLFYILDDIRPRVVKHIGSENKEIIQLEFENGIIAAFHLFSDITLTFQITLFGDNDWQFIEIKNSYLMFKKNIQCFIDSIQNGKPLLSFNKTENVIHTLIAAKKSFLQKGQLIHL